MSEGINIKFTDLITESEDIIKMDLEKTIPIDSNSQDFLILSNVLEHLYDHNNCVSESFRVLEEKGVLIGSVPFLKEVHPDPNDYFRYTNQGLERIFLKAGFKKENIKIKPLGYGPVTAGFHLFTPVLKIKLLIAAMYCVSISCDKILNVIFGNTKYSHYVKKFNFPLGYFFICAK